MVSDAQIKIALSTLGTEKVIDDLKRVEKAEKDVAAADSSGFGGQLTGTTKAGRQVEETITRATTVAQRELNDALSIGKEHSIFTVQSKALELRGVQDIETATGRLAEKKLAEVAASTAAQQGLASFVKALAADATIAATAVTAAMGANKMIWGESLAMANQLAERDGEFAKATEGSRYALALLSGDFSQVKEDASATWEAMSDYADKHAGVVGGLVAGPIGAAVGSYIQKLKDIVTAADDAWDAADESQTKLDFLARSIAEEHAQMLESGKAFYKSFTEADDAATANRLSNLAKIHRAEAELQAGRAKRAGASNEEQAVNSLQSDVQSAVDTQAQMKAARDAALNKNNQAWTEFFEKDYDGGTDEQVAALKATAEKTQIAFDAAQSNLEAAAKEGSLKLQNNAEEATQKVTDAAEKQLTDFGRNLVSELEKQQASGGLDANGLVVLKKVKGLIESDQKVTADEATALLESAKLARGSTANAFEGVNKSVSAILANTQSIISTLQSHDQKIAQQAAIIEELRLQR